MKTSPLLLASIFFLSVAPATPAVTIWDNGVPNGESAWLSDFSDTLQRQEGDNFTLASTVTANQIQWWGVYNPANTPTTPDIFTIRFFTIIGGVPATAPLFEYAIGNPGRVDTGMEAASHELFFYSATIPNTLLGPGDYLLSIVNNTAADTDDLWYWATSVSESGGHWLRFGDGQPWDPQSDELAFKILGPNGNNGNGVPESGTSATLFGFAFVGIIFAQRRFRFVEPRISRMSRIIHRR